MKIARPGQSRLRRCLRWAGIVVLSVVLVPLGYYLVVRYGLGHFHAIVAGQAYRSAEPSPARLAGWRDRYGLKTVIDVRGGAPEEVLRAGRAAAERLGLKVIHVPLRAVYWPTPGAMASLIEALESAERPVLIHCADGADRSGLAGVLAAMAIGGQDYRAARGQLSLWYFHVKRNPRRIAGVLRLYEDRCRGRPEGAGGWREFRHWALNVFPRKFYELTVEGGGEVRLSPGQAGEVRCRVTNRSPNRVHAGRPRCHLSLGACVGPDDAPPPGGRCHFLTPLPREDLRRKRPIELTVPIIAPAQPGRYVVRLDVVEDDFARLRLGGAPMTTCLLVVEQPAAGRATTTNVTSAPTRRN